MSENSDVKFMQMALAAAREARSQGEVPVGACIVGADGNPIAVAGNKTICDSDPTAHAEILVLREAAKIRANYRLTDTTIYTTIEPCAMCAGALVNARVKRLVFGATDERFGAVETIFRICDNSSLNHQLEITKGVLADECRELLQDFFKIKRLNAKE